VPFRKVQYRLRRNAEGRLGYHLWMIKPILGLDPDESSRTGGTGRKARIVSAGCTGAERRRMEGGTRMAEGFRRRGSDPLAVEFGRVMSDPAMRARCAALKVGDSATADVTGGFKVVGWKAVSWRSRSA